MGVGGFLEHTIFSDDTETASNFMTSEFTDSDWAREHHWKYH